MLTRRTFLQTTGTAGAAALAAFTDSGIERVRAASRGAAALSANDVAADENYWREIQQAFTLDRTIINLNNGGCCPSPRVVHEALKRYLDVSNQAPVYHMWQILEPNIETVRRRLAAEFGCDPEELAITRNASEALQIAQLGLDLKAGDEVITTNQDYGRMLDTWEQRVRRDGIKLTKVSFPVPPKSMDALSDRLLSAITPATKVLHFCHITNLTGQIFPVKAICEEARRRGIKTVVDGAHAFAHFPFKASDLACDYYGTSLHKWLLSADRNGIPLRAPREHSGALALDARERETDEGYPEVRGDRHAPGSQPQRDRRGHELSRRHRYRSQVRPSALPAQSLGEPAVTEPQGQDPHEPGPGALVRDRDCADHRCTHSESRRAVVGAVAHHRDADRPRRVRGRAHHAERLHNARGSGYVRGGDGRDCDERDLTVRP